jgi:hypothetical protein
MANRNPKLMTLMFSGCKIIFPSGVILQGLVQDRFIRVAITVPEEPDIEWEVFDLSEEGLENALRAKETYEEDRNTIIAMNIEQQKIELQ